MRCQNINGDVLCFFPPQQTANLSLFVVPSVSFASSPMNKLTVEYW